MHPKMEKYALRKAFDTPENPYLPDDVLWRQKEQFSDGVGYDWVDGLKVYADLMVRLLPFPNATTVRPGLVRMFGAKPVGAMLRDRGGRTCRLW
jgi:asparagine synthetase B (glutamine-hydrolysing)